MEIIRNLVREQVTMVPIIGLDLLSANITVQNVSWMLLIVGMYFLTEFEK